MKFGLALQSKSQIQKRMQRNKIGLFCSREYLVCCVHWPLLWSGSCVIVSLCGICFVDSTVNINFGVRRKHTYTTLRGNASQTKISKFGSTKGTSDQWCSSTTATWAAWARSAGSGKNWSLSNHGGRSAATAQGPRTASCQLCPAAATSQRNQTGRRSTCPNIGRWPQSQRCSAATTRRSW